MSEGDRGGVPKGTLAPRRFRILGKGGMETYVIND